jgi:transposase InsO family protein
VTDITEHPTREGKVYYCRVLDTCSRRIVGWLIDTVQDTDLVVWRPVVVAALVLAAGVHFARRRAK